MLYGAMLCRQLLQILEASLHSATLRSLRDWGLSKKSDLIIHRINDVLRRIFGSLDKDPQEQRSAAGRSLSRSGMLKAKSQDNALEHGSYY